MKIHLSNSIFLGNIDSFIESFDPLNIEILEISSNPKWVSVHPVVLTMVAALGLTVKEKKNIHFDAITAISGHYLERMGLFRILEKKSQFKIKEHESSGRFIPITQIKTSDGLSSFIIDMIPLLHLGKRDSETLSYIISELVRNVLEHSESPHGALVAAQYYSDKNIIRMGIADTGLGIRKTITRFHKANNDLESIFLALTPGITGTTSEEGGTEQNAGAGLFFIKSIAYVNRSLFFIYSGKAFFKLLKRNILKKIKLQVNPAQDKHSSKNDIPTWNGTVVGIDINLNSTEEFTQLLELIRKAYSSAITERKNIKIKKPKFI